MSSNACITALLERIKGIFSKSKPVASGPADPTGNSARQASADALRQVTGSGTKLPKVDRVTESQANMPTFSRTDQGYQASRGGAAATGGNRRPSSTFTKLQALSASGIGSAQPGGEQPEQSLNNILERMDQKRSE
jgi:hypothetical protein